MAAPERRGRQEDPHPIEGPSEEAVRKAVAALGFDYEQARYGSIDLIYKSELNRDILAEPTLLFTE